MSAHWWDDQDGVVGGRDCVGGGTWFCAGVNGRVAFVTNIRNRRALKKGAPSRGELPVRFVAGTSTPIEYLQQVIANGQHAGFNLVVADLSLPVTKKTETGNKIDDEESSSQSNMYYYTNSSKYGDDVAPEGPVPLAPGLHGLSNASLNQPWPKVRRGIELFQQLMDSGAFDSVSDVGDASGPLDGFPWEDIFHIMSDDTKLLQDGNTPDTGYGCEFETAASSIFIQPIQLDGVEFGTRSTTVLVVSRNGQAELRERYITDNGSGWAEERHTFQMVLGEGYGC